MSESQLSELMTVQQAMDVIDRTPVYPQVERRPLREAAGLRLAEDLVADRDYPPFRKSLMDGFAVHAADLERLPVELPVVGEIAAGNPPQRPLDPGMAIAIMTGAELPEGADGVVPVEDTEAFPGKSAVRILAAGHVARHIAARGSDCTAGTVVLRKGTLIGPAQTAVAASVGAATVSVFARPRVAVLGTGTELVPMDQTPGGAQIRNSNNPMLVSLLERLNCDVTDLGFVEDDPETLRAALAGGLQYDALFVTGGMSMGTHDYVPRLLQELGVVFKVTKLKIKPGKPFVFGVAGEARHEGTEARRHEGVELAGADAGVTRASEHNRDDASSSLRASVPSCLRAFPTFTFGLPGNPVSAYVCTVRLASRMLARMAGGAVEDRWLTGRLEMGLPANGPREFYQPAIRQAPPGGRSAQAEFAHITPLNWKGSADLFTLAQANALLVRAENEPPLPKGTLVRVLEI